MTSNKVVGGASCSFTCHSPHSRPHGGCGQDSGSSGMSSKPYVTRGRLYTLGFFLVFTSFALLLHALYSAPSAGQAPILCLDIGHGHQRGGFASVDFFHDRLRFPRTKRRLPQCIIIGVRKCGTRALLEFLNLHPLVQKAAEEVHFFDDDGRYGLGMEWYRRRMPYSFPNQVTVEKSPAYFVTPSVPYRIRAMNSSIKLLVILRDPVTRLVSDYAQLAANKARKVRGVASFDELVLRPDGSVNTSYKAVRTSMYSVHFRRWLRLFPRRQIHVVDGDRLIVDPLAEVRRIETFLGLPHRVMRDNFYYNRTKGFFCVRNETERRCLNESKGRRHPAVSQDTISRLRQFYAPHNRNIYRLVGHDFGWPEK